MLRGSGGICLVNYRGQDWSQGTDGYQTSAMVGAETAMSEAEDGCRMQNSRAGEGGG